uniref:P-loop containing nucleoside triphosphate hydrolase protein n=1 Tax=Macrostomum lignano TaxID=282301 RepID=A0A1I8GX67_9PLAT
MSQQQKSTLDPLAVASDKQTRRKEKDEVKKKRAALVFVERRLEARAELKLKIILIGSSGVGKSSLLSKFLEETADIGQMQLTILCDFFHCMLRLGGRTVQLRMWDTGGMERFEAMNLASNFYRNAHGVMLVFSVTDLASFESLPRWLDRARASIGGSGATGEGGEFECCLVGNKADEEYRRLVSHREAQRYANQLGVPYIETSALNVVNVQKAFVDLTLAIMRSRLPLQEDRSQTAAVKLRQQKAQQRLQSSAEAFTDEAESIGYRRRRKLACVCL